MRDSKLARANDESLPKLAKRGERVGIDMLFPCHISGLRRTALKLLRDEAGADDVVHDSLTLAFVHLSQYEGRASAALRKLSRNVKSIAVAQRPSIQQERNSYRIAVDASASRRSHRVR